MAQRKRKHEKGIPALPRYKVGGSGQVVRAAQPWRSSRHWNREQVSRWFEPPSRVYWLHSSSFISGVILGVLAAPPVALIAIGLVAGLALRFTVNKPWLTALSCICLLLGYSYALFRTPRPQSDDISIFAGRRVTIFGVIESSKVITDKCETLTLRAEKIAYPEIRTVSGRISITVTSCVPHSGTQSLSGATVPLAENSCVEVRGRVFTRGARAHPYEVDPASSLQRRGIFCEMRVARNMITGTEDRLESPVPRGSVFHQFCRVGSRCAYFIDLWVHNMRTKMVAFHSNVLGKDNGEVLSSMVLGDRAVDLNEDIRQQFRDAGLAHVLAASGYNLTVVTVLASLIAKLFLRSQKTISLSCMSAVGTFVLLAGVSPSILRAAVMCTIVLLAHCTRRTVYMPAALVTALMVAVLLNPLSLTDIGLQLSYAATAAMIFGSRLISEPITDKPKCVRLLYELVASTLLAQAAVLPLQLWYFYETSVYFLLANVLTGLIVPVVCALGFVSSILVMVSASLPGAELLARVVDHTIQTPLASFLWCVKTISALPGAVAPVGQPHLASIAFFYSFLTALFLLGWTGSSRWICLGLLVSLLALLVREPLQNEVSIKVARATLTIHKDRTAVLLPTQRLPNGGIDTANALQPTPPPLATDACAQHRPALSSRVRKIRRILAFYGARLTD